MSINTIQTLYDELFGTIKALRAGKMSVEDAKGVADVSNALTRAIECELKCIDKIGAKGTGIISEAHLTPREGEEATRPALVSPQRKIAVSVTPVNNWPRLSKDGTDK
jgi:hypothetical protein